MSIFHFLKILLKKTIHFIHFGVRPTNLMRLTLPLCFGWRSAAARQRYHYAHIFQYLTDLVIVFNSFSIKSSLSTPLIFLTLMILSCHFFPLKNGHFLCFQSPVTNIFRTFARDSIISCGVLL